MKAIVKTQKCEGFMELKECDIPVISDDEVLIKVSYAGICGTDIHIKHDQFPYWPPVIMGHEFSGTVVEVGKNVTDYAAGDNVVGEPHNLACGKCHLCRNGKIQLCEQKRSIGWGIDGVFSEYVKMPEKLLHKIPAGVSLKTAAMAEPCAIVAHQVLERTNITPGDYVVVMGMGPIAIIAAQMARVAGAERIVMCGCTSDVDVRLKIAEKTQCLDKFINVQTENAVDIILSETNGKGADVVIEASGAASAIKSAIFALKKTGTFCGIGMTNAEEILVPWNTAMRKAIDLKFNMSSSYNGWNIALSLMASKKLMLDELIKIMRLDDFEEAFTLLETGKAIKILFDCNL